MCKKMKIEVRCFATISNYAPKDGFLEVSPNSTIKDIMDLLKLPENEVKVIFVNGKHEKKDYVLKDGDRVAFFPAVGGG